MQFLLVQSRDQKHKRLDRLGQIIDEWDFNYPLKLEIKKYTNNRSMAQNDMVHMWFRDIAEYLASRGFKIEDQPINGDDVKLMMKHLFLGYRDIVKGNLVIKDQLVETRKLSTGEMHHFMDQVYDYAQSKGLYLKIPVESEYRKLKDAQNG